MARVLRRSCGLTAEGLADALLADLDEFSGEAPAFDDQTLIVMKVR